MNHQQEGVVYGYSEQVTYVTTAGPTRYMYPSAPPPLPPPPPPPPPRRMSPFRILVRAFIGACIFIGALALLIWLICRPRTIQVAVTTATLARFDLDNTTSVLSYSLAAVVAVSNPNRRVSIYYDQLQVGGFYQEERFGRAALPVSFQGTRHADAVPALLVGNTSMELGGSGVVAAFDEDRRAGVFPVDLWVDGVVRYKFGELMTTTASTLTVKCHLVLKLTVASGWVECAVIDS